MNDFKSKTRTKLFAPQRCSKAQPPSSPGDLNDTTLGDDLTACSESLLETTSPTPTKTQRHLNSQLTRIRSEKQRLFQLTQERLSKFVSANAKQLRKPVKASSTSIGTRSSLSGRDPLQCSPVWNKLHEVSRDLQVLNRRLQATERLLTAVSTTSLQTAASPSSCALF